MKRLIFLLIGVVLGFTMSRFFDLSLPMELLIVVLVGIMAMFIGKRLSA